MASTSSAGASGLSSFKPSAGGVLDQRLASDVQSVDALRHTVRTSPLEGMKQASKQFEVLFMQMMLKSMREATPTEGMFGSQNEKMFTSMLDQQLAQNLSGKGLGLAEAMFAQLKRSSNVQTTLPGSEATQQPGTSTPADMAADPLLKPATPLPGITAPVARPVMPAAARSGAHGPNLSLYEAATGQATLSRSALPQAHVEQFVTRLLPAAQRASEASGVPAQLIMAQAALESGWGRHEIREANGQPSYNLFGIKAGKNWKGPVVEVNTTEYVNGVPQKTRALFRSYHSYEEGFSDYARLLGNNPRYASVRTAQNPAQAALDLQSAGYATDPQYGGKLIRIMKQMA